MTETEESTETTTEKTPSQADLFSRALEESSRKADARQAELLAEVRAERKAAEAKTVSASNPERIYTADEVQAMVDAQKISQAAAIDYLTEVKSQKAAKASEERLQAQLKEAVAHNAYNVKINAYADAIPELRDQSSEAFKTVKKIYDDLLAEGEEATPKTELRAIQIEYGRDPAKHRKTEVVERTSERRTQESAGSRGSKSSATGVSSSGVPKWLPPGIAAHYEKQIEKGRYKGAKDPNFIAEMKIAEKKYKQA
jgi:hypothetical protein